MSKDDQSLEQLIKDPRSKKQQVMMTPQEFRVVTIGPEHIVKEG